MNKTVYDEDEVNQLTMDERISCCEFDINCCDNRIDNISKSLDSIYSRIAIDEYTMAEEIADTVDDKISPFKVFWVISIVSLLISIISLINNRRNK